MELTFLAIVLVEVTHFIEPTRFKISQRNYIVSWGREREVICSHKLTSQMKVLRQLSLEVMLEVQQNSVTLILVYFLKSLLFARLQTGACVCSESCRVAVEVGWGGAGWR